CPPPTQRSLGRPGSVKIRPGPKPPSWMLSSAGVTLVQTPVGPRSCAPPEPISSQERGFGPPPPGPVPPEPALVPPLPAVVVLPPLLGAVPPEPALVIEPP